jgi:hypothetical protein
MESWKAEGIKDKFSAKTPGHLSVSETRYWARLRRVYDGDLDAFERPDEDIRTPDEEAEDAALEQIAAQLAARATAETAEVGA